MDVSTDGHLDSAAACTVDVPRAAITRVVQRDQRVAIGVTVAERGHRIGSDLDPSQSYEPG